MSDLTIVASVTRQTVPGGPLAALSLENPGAYRVVALAPGGIVWRRHTAESKWVHGRTLISAIKDAAQLGLVLRVYGSTQAALEVNTATLLAAFEQWSYDLAVSVDGVAHSWRCEPADYGPAGGEDDGWDRFSLMAFQQAYRFTIPRAPVPLAGSM